MAKPNWTLFRGYWNLDEAANTNAIDSSPNVFTLAQGGGAIASAEGGRDLEETSSQYFNIVDQALLSFADVEFTIGIWPKLESQASNQVFIGKADHANNDIEYYLRYENATDRYQFSVSSDGTVGNMDTAIATTYGAVPATTQAFVMGWHDPTANKIYISVDNGVVDEAAHAGGCNDNISPFRLGAYGGVAVSGEYDGILWSGFVYAGLMTAAERTWMYNAGVPRKWSEIYFVPRAGMI